MSRLHPEWFVEVLDVLDSRGRGLIRYLHRGCISFYVHKEEVVEYCPRCGDAFGSHQVFDKARWDRMERHI